MNEETGETMELSEIYKKVIPSVVSISATGNGSTSTGTGIIMSQDGYIITNYHVVSTANQITVLLTDETEYAASVVGGDETSDLMVLKIDAENLTPAEFGDSDQMEVGDAVVAIGDPLGIELRGTMTNGIICGIKRDVSVEDRTMTLMQTNAALNSGNSGGPLVNMMGQVIGINTMKLTSDYASVEGIGFAIPISTAKPIVDELVEKGYVTGRPAFGFTVEALDARILLYYNLPGRLCVRSVDADSDAYAQGIREGDIITAADGTTVSSTEELSRIKNAHTAGDQITMTVYRNGKSYEVTVTLMEQNEQ
jgi:serine protease Do